MNRLRLLTAGESHGPGMSGILDGLPAGLRVSTREVDRDLARRQHGYGSGRRMQIERDRVAWSAGLRFGRTLGSPLAFTIANRDWVSWTERMSVEPIPGGRKPKPITLARPGHADLAGAIKYDTPRHPRRARAGLGTLHGAAGRGGRGLPPAAGGVAASRSGASSTSWAPSARSRMSTTRSTASATAGGSATAVDPTPLRCPDPEAEAAMMAEVDAVIEAGDSIGGSFVVVVEGMPIGVGSNAEWDTRLDTALAAAMMGIQAVKGVEIGLGFGVLARRGSAVHDEVDPDAPSWGRRTNRAGGVEGGMSNGAPIVVRAAVKPVATLRKPLDSVDLRDRPAGPRPHRAQRRGHPAARRGRGRGDDRARRSRTRCWPRSAATPWATSWPRCVGAGRAPGARAARPRVARPATRSRRCPTTPPSEATPVPGRGRVTARCSGSRLLGQGIAYSASPAMMAAAFAALGLPHRYAIADVAPADLPAAVAALRAPDVGGANVTTPHKAAVAHLVR